MVEVSGQKHRSEGGSAQWRHPRRRHSVLSITFGDMAAWRFPLSFLRCLLRSKTGLLEALCTPLSAVPRCGFLQVPPSVLLDGWCVGEECQDEASFFGGVRRPVETWLCCLVYDRLFFVVVVMSMMESESRSWLAKRVVVFLFQNLPFYKIKVGVLSRKRAFNRRPRFLSSNWC